MSFCPTCQHFLGPISSLFNDWNPPPNDVESYSYIKFECCFSGQIGCRIEGDGPVVVTTVNSDAVITSALQLSSHGDSEKTDMLSKKGLQPEIGDVLISVCDTNISHLNTVQV